MLLIAAPLVYLAAETATAAAWTSPRYDYTYDYVINLGVPGPRSEAFDQTQHSLLTAVMNVGFIAYGLLIGAAAAFLLTTPSNGLFLTLQGTTAGFGVGAILLSIFPGSEESVANGNIVFHTLGAQMTIVAGNLFAVLFGLLGRRAVGPSWSFVSVTLGLIGLISLGAFLAYAQAGGDEIIGLLEHGAIYPFVLAHLLLGCGLLRTHRATPRDSIEEPSLI
ncbi:DUF998 domain-containing protein [Streptomyces sp. enrichment culture]|uniref:DUF998 domain-containing protein n=1 Tax=Streptomyces sp. enrichment culture TaxID=1795815 RepID=UPI003F5624A1